MDILIVSCVIIIIVLAIGIHEKTTNAICVSRRRLEGRTVIVTGGTAGMGLVIATDLAHRGARVIIACPFKEEGFKAEQQIIEETQNQNVTFKLLDLASIKSVRTFAADIVKTEDRLDVLVNNAGIGVPANFLTEDNMSFIMQVNYYGTFLLTLLLLPLLKKSGKPGDCSRIITTSSVFHLIGRMDIDNLNKTNYLLLSLQGYANSKICLVFFVKELARKLKGSNVVVNNVDPGFVGTRIFDSLHKVVGIFMTAIAMLLFKTPLLGAQTALHAALDSKAGEVSGGYFKNCKLSRMVRSTSCDKTVKNLWEQSVKLVKLTDEEIEKCFQSM